MAVQTPQIEFAQAVGEEVGKATADAEVSVDVEARLDVVLVTEVASSHW